MNMVGDLRRSDSLVPSRFNLSVDLPDGRKAVFNTFSLALIKMDRDTWRRLLRPGAKCCPPGAHSDKTLRLFCDKGLLVPLGVDELDLVRLQHLGRRYSREELSVYVTPTLACNLQCSYCFERLAQERPTRKAMNRRTEGAVVRYIATQAQGMRRVRLMWFGGEPLLGLPAIERISNLLVPAFDNVGVQYSAAMDTNGVLVDRNVVKVLKAARVRSAQITVDVPRSEKRDRRGRDTMDRVLDGVALLAGALDVTIRVNLSRDDEAEFDALYQALCRRRLQKRLRLIYCADVRHPECGCSRSLGFLSQDQYLPIVAREQAKAARVGLPVNTLRFETPSCCIATRISGVVIGPDGSLYKCPEDIGLVERAYGTVWGADVTLSNWVPWMAHDGFQYKQCRNCPVLPQCGGGCPHRRLFQARELKDEEFCDWTRCGNLEDRIRQHAMLHGSDGSSASRT
jgi:uncharacterized protein